jgi:kinesin family protein 11
VAAREKNGVYIAMENYQQMTNEIDAQSKEIVEKLERIKAMEDELARKEETFQQLQMLFDEQKNVLQVRPSAMKFFEAFY